ncbi:MAG: methionine biosynthesis protein MetW [Nanoarchaeota archaeon]
MEYLRLIGTSKENDLDKSCLNVPLEYQLAVLGINNKVIASLQGKQVMDVGCGNGSLVNYLISQGIHARGIDSKAPEGPQFTRRWVIGQVAEEFQQGTDLLTL